MSRTLSKDEMQAVLKLFEGIVHVHFERYAEALEACRRAESLKRDMPGDAGDPDTGRCRIGVRYRGQNPNR